MVEDVEGLGLDLELVTIIGCRVGREDCSCDCACRVADGICGAAGATVLVPLMTPVVVVEVGQAAVLITGILALPVPLIPLGLMRCDLPLNRC